MNTGWIVLGSIVGVAVLSLFLHIRGMKQLQALRRQAVLLGLRIDQVERNIPFFEDNSAEPELERQRVAAYRLSHSRTKCAHWSLLQRAEQPDAEFPHGWELNVERGEIPGSLRQVLADIAKEWDEDYLEFECGPREISGFWEEGGGPNMAKKIHGYLSRISEFAR